VIVIAAGVCPIGMAAELLAELLVDLPLDRLGVDVDLGAVPVEVLDEVARVEDLILVVAIVAGVAVLDHHLEVEVEIEVAVVARAVEPAGDGAGVMSPDSMRSMSSPSGTLLAVFCISGRTWIGKMLTSWR
jgi:hypothetical protein